MRRCGSDDGLRQMAPRPHPRLSVQHPLVQMGAVRPRSLPHWSKGRATLLGDSAHAMLPYLGTGAGIALEDACVLAATVARQPDDLDAALLAYERRRAPRGQGRRARRSRDTPKENHLASPWARLKRDAKFALRERFGAGRRGDTTAFQVGWLFLARRRRSEVG